MVIKNPTMLKQTESEEDEEEEEEQHLLDDVLKENRALRKELHNILDRMRRENSKVAALFFVIGITVGVYLTLIIQMCLRS